MTSRRPHSFGLLLAWLALLVQLGFAQPLPRSDAMAIDAAMTLCHAEGGATNSPTPAAPHTPDCAICPLCLTIAGTGYALPPGPPPTPTASVVITGRVALAPPPTAPPAGPRFTGQPRAPPVPA